MDGWSDTARWTERLVRWKGVWRRNEGEERLEISSVRHYIGRLPVLSISRLRLHSYDISCQSIRVSSLPNVPHDGCCRRELFVLGCRQCQRRRPYFHLHPRSHICNCGDLESGEAEQDELQTLVVAVIDVEPDICLFISRACHLLL